MTKIILSTLDVGVVHYKNDKGSPHRAWFNDCGVLRTTEGIIPDHVSTWLRDNHMTVQHHQETIMRLRWKWVDKDGIPCYIGGGLPKWQFEMIKLYTQIQYQY